MIGITKLLTGTATVSAAMRADNDAHMLQFSAENRPVVVWNSTGRCNLECKHCYAAEYVGADELSTDEARAFLDDLAQMGVPVALFSGGEPLMREDVFELVAHAREKGLRPVLSTNGTLITPEVAARLADAGVVYVGVSLDGRQATHDRFRGRRGAFTEALAGLRAAAAVGIRTGVRFTLVGENFRDLPGVLDLVERNGVKRFCMYHLVYAGRGRSMAPADVTLQQSREAVTLLIDTAVDWAARGVDTEILTADNHADGALLLRHIERTDPGRAEEVRELLAMSGGCSAGRKIASVGPSGDVYACQFWSAEPLGNLRCRPFSGVWGDSGIALLSELRSGSGESDSRCSLCTYRDLCRGCRIRALASGGDIWGGDPQCYLTDEEIGLV